MATISQTLANVGNGGTGARTRVAGSAFTVFTWNHVIVGFAQQVAYVSPTPVAPPTPIHPMDTPYVLEIATPAAQTIGTITLSMFETYNTKFWEQLGGLQGAPDLVNVFIRVASFGLGGINVTKVIRPPLLNGVSPTNPLSQNTLNQIAGGNPIYGETYNNCVVTNITDGETVDIGTMFLAKQITLAYTHITPISPTGGASAYQPNVAFQLANRSVPATFG